MPAPEEGPVTRSELKSELDAVRTEIQQGFTQIREGFAQMREYIDERTRDMQTELLRGFADYNHSN
jgi:hypothetical protein